MVKDTFSNLLNVRYVLYRPDPNGPVQVLENRDCLGQAFVAADGVIGRLAGRESDFRNVVLLEEYPGCREMPGEKAGVVQV